MTHILGISGSLRAASTNTALLRSAAAHLPAGASLTVAAIDTLPHFNSDLADPAALDRVERLKAAITEADAVLIATPEYNFSIPGPLKNAIDWASRPAYKSPFFHKPVGILGAAASFVGSARAQGHLKQVLLGMGSQVFPHNEFLVGRSFEKVSKDAEPVITDASTLEHLTSFLAGFTEWVRRVTAR